MVGWHHWLNGHESEQALGVGDGQASLVCLASTGSGRVRHNLVTEQQQQKKKGTRYWCTTWVDLKIIMLNQRSQTQKTTLWLYITWHSGKGKAMKTESGKWLPKAKERLTTKGHEEVLGVKYSRQWFHDYIHLVNFITNKLCLNEWFLFFLVALLMGS